MQVALNINQEKQKKNERRTKYYGRVEIIKWLTLPVQL
jgi:hypothetical protein